MYYIIIIYAVGALIGKINPYIYYDFLMLDVDKVLHGQIWRIITFIFAPNNSNLFFLFIELYLYYSIGSSIENYWGAFRFNLYYLTGIIFNILAILIVYIFTGISMPIGITYLNQSLFLAFSALFPNVQLLLFFVIPIKVKYLGYLYGAMIAFEAIQYFAVGGWYMTVAICVAMANFIIFFVSSRNMKRISPKEIRRKKTYKKHVNSIKKGGITRHKCAICGRTELDDENLEFRFCSKCEGNYEYCMEHLFSHQHVHKK